MRLFVICVLLALWRPASAQSFANTDPLRKAAAYLWAQQADDGGWHSEQYAVLRSGQALTPFVLHTLLGTIDAMSSDETGRVMKAIEFIRNHVHEDGSIGRADADILEYPVYSTAYSVLCLKRIQAYRHLRSEENARLIARMKAYLVSAQYDESDGFTVTDPAYGGWGFDRAQQPGQPGHMDLAHTRRVLQAISRPPKPAEDMQTAVVLAAAQRFLMVVQKVAKEYGPFDGGFYFSPVVLAANKGREGEKDGTKYFHSYATATCDGILALLAAEVPRDDERIVRAVDWLRKHDDLTYPQGVPLPRSHTEPWGEAIRFYHYAVRAEVYAALDWPGEWRGQLSATIAAYQAVDGSFRNAASPLMKEDDPLLCTALAAIALTHCVSGNSDQEN